MRTLLIDIPGLSGRLLDSLPEGSIPAWFTNLVGTGRRTVKPVLPAVTMPVQASLSTGVSPAKHGIIANGLPAYRLPELKENLDLSNFQKYRCNVSFWEQSNKLLSTDRIWQTKGETASMMMVQSSMGGAADVVVTPKPEHSPDGKTKTMCWSHPAEVYPDLVEQLGQFPLMHYWGPLANLKSSEWIVAAARLVWETHPVGLQWVYIPQMDYDLQRFGPGDARCVDSLIATLGLLTPLVASATRDGGRVLIFGEYGLTPVDTVISPNLALAQAGLLATTDDGEIDYDNSKAFAMVDHQVAHVYCDSDDEVAVLAALPDVASIHRGPERAAVGLDCDRAGNIVAFAPEDAWFEYRWWSDWNDAPDWAFTVDIHRKPGYDPTDMFANPATRKTLPDQPQLVKGSHGTLPIDSADWPVLLGECDAAVEIDTTDIAGLLC